MTESRMVDPVPGPPPEKPGMWKRTKTWVKKRPVVRGALVGAGTGAAAGSFIPGLGTVTGGIFGGAAGAISGAIYGDKED